MSLKSLIHKAAKLAEPELTTLPQNNGNITVAEDILKQAFNSVIRKYPMAMMALYDNDDMDHKMARLICDELSKMGYWIGECAF